MEVQQGGDGGLAEGASKEMERELGPSLWCDEIREGSPQKTPLSAPLYPIP